MKTPSHRNRLASETSAYLLQHATNPVDWYPWGDEALSRARELQRPILLSVGYSACHWCHVMERESFENEEIASLMNEHFVCIKVDREERPDVDHLYMTALQGMTGRGGWPMTIFLTPDAQPFFGGTYFPPEDRAGMAGFPRVLQSVIRTWRERYADVVDSAARMVDFLGRERTRGAIAGSEAEISDAARSLASAMDEQYGGFGRAPKFPATMALSLLLETAAGPDDATSHLVRTTLDGMAAGGIRDHLGGGFHRYSVDREWLVPHFEKMLYDQALLVDLYLQSAKAFGRPDDQETAVEILDYLRREMTSPEGGLYSAQDADSEGEEGRFFVWTPDEVMEVLGNDVGRCFCERYDVTVAGNFEGRSILHVTGSSPSPASAQDARQWKSARKALLARRSLRVAPGTDTKVVADWNALAISSMARAAALTGRSDFAEAAERAMDFLQQRLVQDARLRHVFAGGVAKVPAFLDDYAFVGCACLELFALRPERRHFEGATRAAETLLDEFRDADGGGFFFSGNRDERLVARMCDLHDAAVPAGNSAAAELMWRLWTMTGEARYRQALDGVLARFLPDALRQPYGAAQLLRVAVWDRRGAPLVVVAGQEDARERLSQRARQVYHPGCMVIALPDWAAEWLPGALRGKKPPDTGAAAYICHGMSCSLPVTDDEELRNALRWRDWDAR